MLFELYNNNQRTFHTWLWKKKEYLTGTIWFPVTSIVSGSVLAVAIMFQVMQMQEISTYGYKDLISDQKEYGKEIPAFKPTMAEFYEDDDMISEGEYDELQELIRAHWREEARVAKIKAKAKITKVINE